MVADISCGFPSFCKAVAHNASESLYPELWKGLVAAYCPQVMLTRTALLDLTPYKNHATVSPNSTFKGYNKRGINLQSLNNNASSASFSSKPQIDNINNSHTVAMWIRPALLFTSGYDFSTLIRKSINDGTTYESHTFSLLLSNTGRFLTTSSRADDPNYGCFYSNIILTAYQQYFIAVTNDGTATKLYVNGELDNSTTGLHYYNNTTLVNMFTQSGSSAKYDGQAGTTFIYNRSLVASEIKNLYINSDNIFIRTTARRFEGIPPPPTVRATYSDSCIQGTTTQNILSDTSINPNNTILSNAVIEATTTQDILSATNIKTTQQQLILSDTAIFGTVVKTALSNTKVVLTRVKTILSDADIFRTQTGNTLSDTNIKVTTTKTILSSTAVYGIQIRTIMSDTIIFQPLDLHCEVSFTKNSQKDFYIESEVIQVTPDVPFNVTIANAGSGDAVRIEWEGTSLFYNVYMVETGPVYTKMNAYLISNHFYVVGGLQEGVEYTFVVRGADGQG
jgi:hypothetical protein